MASPRGNLPQGLNNLQLRLQDWRAIIAKSGDAWGQKKVTKPDEARNRLREEWRERSRSFILLQPSVPGWCNW